LPQKSRRKCLITILHYFDNFFKPDYMRQKMLQNLGRTCILRRRPFTQEISGRGEAPHPRGFQTRNAAFGLFHFTGHPKLRCAIDRQTMFCVWLSRNAALGYTTNQRSVPLSTNGTSSDHSTHVNPFDTTVTVALDYPILTMLSSRGIMGCLPCQLNRERISSTETYYLLSNVTPINILNRGDL